MTAPALILLAPNELSSASQPANNTLSNTATSNTATSPTSNTTMRGRNAPHLRNSTSRPHKGKARFTKTNGTVRELATLISRLRPDIPVQPATPNNIFTVIDQLIESNHDEIVIVPARIAGQANRRLDDRIRGYAQQLSETSHRANIVITESLGWEANFLNIVDERLRAALSDNHVRELDALVLAGPGSTDPAVNAALSRAARIWGKHHNLPTIAAFGAHVPPAVSEAVRTHRADGRRHIAVGRMFLIDDTLSDHVAELAYEAGAIAVSQPLGAHEALAQLALTRYGVGSLALLPFDSSLAFL